MKKQIIILGLGLFTSTCSFVFGYYSYNGYPNYQPYHSSINRNYYYNPYQRRYYTVHCPCCGKKNYNTYYVNPYTTNVSRVKHIRRMKKIKRKMKNQISWFNNNNNSALTGYSIPVQKNILNNFPFQKQKNLLSSPTANTELWGKGSGEDGYNYGFSGFEKYNDNSKNSAKTGVTIIYD